MRWLTESDLEKSRYTIYFSNAMKHFGCYMTLHIHIVTIYNDDVPRDFWFWVHVMYNACFNFKTLTHPWFWQTVTIQPFQFFKNSTHIFLFKKLSAPYICARYALGDADAWRCDALTLFSDVRAIVGDYDDTHFNLKLSIDKVSKDMY